jgi:hypothetical protein
MLLSMQQQTKMTRCWIWRSCFLWTKVDFMVKMLGKTMAIRNYSSGLLQPYRTFWFDLQRIW